MTALDYAVLAIVGLSVLVSVVRGLVREVLALAAWAVGFVVATLYSGEFAVLLPAAISDERLRLLAAFIVLFLLVLVAMSVVAYLVVKLVRSAGLGVEDRVLGGIFGFARGLLVVMVLVLAAGFTSLPRAPVWRDAMLSGPLEACAIQVKGWLPSQFSQRIAYN